MGQTAPLLIISGILSFPDRLEILIRCNQSEQFLTSCCLGGGWRWKLFLDVGNGNDKPSDPPILWDHHFMIKSYFNLKLCILCKIYLDMSTENSGKRTLKMLSTFNWMKKFLSCRFLCVCVLTIDPNWWIPFFMQFLSKKIQNYLTIDGSKNML